MMIQSLRQKWKQYLKKWSLWSPFVSLWLGSCFRNFSGFSYFFPGLFRLFRWDWGAVLGISAISATFSLAFSGCFAGFGQLFQEFQQFQLLFSRIFPAFGLDWGAVLEVLWITATQGLPAINLWLLYIMLIQCGEYYAKE